MGHDEDGDTEPEEASASPSKPDLANAIYEWWPSFVYFVSFQDILLRQVDVDSIISGDKASSKIARPVRGSLVLVAIEPAKIKALERDDKALGNYLDRRGVEVTGDFLTCWQQRVDGDQNVRLRVEHLRDESVKLKLAFYVRDQVDQYPEQRSRGFLWFLSFYLRLAGQYKRQPNASRRLLIDEPGSYPHARA